MAELFYVAASYTAYFYILGPLVFLKELMLLCVP